MLKLSRNGIGVLTSQYKSVLKKCALLNMVAAGFLMFTPPVHAAGTGINIESLRTMGTEIGEDKEYSILFVNGETGNNIKEMFSGNDERAWITNYGIVRLGEGMSGGEVVHVDTTISNKHSTPRTDSTSSMMPSEGGGVISNQSTDDLISARTEINGVTFNNNSISEFYFWYNPDAVSDGNDHRDPYHKVAAGGVVANVGIYDGQAAPSEYVMSKNSTYTNNYAMEFIHANGGALYNSMAMGPTGVAGNGKLVSRNDVFRYNHVGNEDMSLSVFDVVRDAVTSDVRENITDVWNARWKDDSAVKASHPNGVTSFAGGGALFNSGDTEVHNGTFEYNYSTGEESFGGAVYNTDRMFHEPSPEYVNRDGILTFYGENSFKGNIALATSNVGAGVARGGAIANLGTTLVFDNQSTEKTKLTFENNSARSGYTSYGGALFNSVSFDLDQGSVYNIRGATFKDNYAEVIDEPEDHAYAFGGAIYNDSVMVINDAVFEGNYAKTKSSSTFRRGLSYGGAIYNAGTLGFGADPLNTGEDDAYVPQDLKFINNTVVGSQGVGGAIYNQGGTIIGNFADVSVIFSGNTDGVTPSGQDPTVASSGGGAIYGGSAESRKSSTTFNLSGTANVQFQQYNKDNVFMEKGNSISFIGDNAAPGERSNVSTSTIDTDKTRVDLGATFTGVGNYVIKNTQLNLIDGTNGTGTGYIDFYPSIDMRDSVVNMEGSMTSFFYLSSNNDVLVNNDFYIKNKDAVLYYADYDSSYNQFTLGNYIDNSGLIVYDDMPQNGMAAKIYPDEITSGDSDIKIATTLINRGAVSTAVDGYITHNVHIGTLQSDNGKFYINMDNSNLIKTDNEHVLIPEAPEGYEFGTYEGQHYNSEVIVIDDKVKGTSQITLVDLTNTDYSQVALDVGQRIYFAQTQVDQGLTGYTWNVTNAVNDNYQISIGYDENGSVYDWFLYRGAEVEKLIPPEDMVAITIPRATLEQLRSIRFPLDRTNRGQCSCYQDNCNNSFCQYEHGSPKTRLWLTPFYRQGTFKKPFETDFKLLGVDLGMDYQPTETDLIGIFGSYRFGKYENDGNQKHYGDKKKYFSVQGGELELKSLTAGLYYRKYIENLYIMGAAYGGKIDGDIKADNGVKGSIDGKHVGAQIELGYDIKTTRRTTLTPSFRGTYDYIKFDKGHTNNGKKISVGKINSFEMEAALKLEYRFNNERQLSTTGYLKPSVIQTIPDGGKVKVGDTEYTKTLDNETLGRIEVGADTNLTTNFAVGVFGNYTFGSSYEAWGVGGNLRYTW